MLRYEMDSFATRRQTTKAVKRGKKKVTNNEGGDNQSCKYKSYINNVKEFYDNEENLSLFR